MFKMIGFTFPKEIKTRCKTKMQTDKLNVIAISYQYSCCCMKEFI